MKYDLEKNKYVIKYSSSLFDDELSDIYNRGESYKKIMRPFIMTHSNLLAFDLYDSYQTDKERVKEIIGQLFNMIGVVNDEEIFNLLQDYSCYNSLIHQHQLDYKSLKKKKIFSKIK